VTTDRQTVEALIRSYLQRMPDAEHVYHSDPVYHAQMHILRRALIAVDMAMEDEGVPHEVRLRVLRAGAYGSLDEGCCVAAHRRRSAAGG
jgi:hypothetical protein